MEVVFHTETLGRLG